SLRSQPVANITNVPVHAKGLLKHEHPRMRSPVPRTSHIGRHLGSVRNHHFHFLFHNCCFAHTAHRTPPPSASYQTRQAFSATMGCPALHPNACWKPAEFCTAPFTRQRPGECGSTSTRLRASG